VNERRYYDNGVGDEVYQLQTVVVHHPTEEAPRWEVEVALEEGGEDDVLLDVLAWELFPGGSPLLHLRLRSEQTTVHQRLDLGLSHRRLNPRCLQVWDGSSLRRHFTTRVDVGSNVAQGFYAHTQVDDGAEQRR
jgi:hypothetical protein